MVTMSAVWDRTSEFLGDHRAALAGIAGLAIFGPSAVEGVLQPLNATAQPATRLGLSLVSLVLSLVSLWGQLSLVALVLEPALSSRGAWGRGAARLPALIVVSLILLLAMLVLAVPVAVIAIGGGLDVNAMANGVMPNLDPGAALGIVLYTLVLLPVVLWLSARLVVVSPVVVAERVMAGAIPRSFRLTRGLAGRIVGVVILFLILAGVSVLAAQSVFGSILRIVLGDDGTINAAGVLTALVVALVTTVLTVIANVFVAELYLAIRDQRAADPAAA